MSNPSSNLETAMDTLRAIVEEQSADRRFLPVDMALLRRVVATPETNGDPTRDPKNAEIVARLKVAFSGDPDLRILADAMSKLADGAIGPPHGCAILTHRECDAMGKELHRLAHKASGASSEKTATETPAVRSTEGICTCPPHLDPLGCAALTCPRAIAARTALKTSPEGAS